jgi:multidrug efflux system membrane fusion protein
VQTGQQGEYVFVVKPDLTVESRPVVVGSRVGEDMVIEERLKPGERVVTSGQVRLVPGSKVEIRNPPDRPERKTPAAPDVVETKSRGS